MKMALRLFCAMSCCARSMRAWRSSVVIGFASSRIELSAMIDAGNARPEPGCWRGFSSCASTRGVPRNSTDAAPTALAPRNRRRLNMHSPRLHSKRITLRLFAQAYNDAAVPPPRQPASSWVILVRLLVGWVFVAEGLQKFIFRDALGGGRFERIGFPAPHALAVFVALVEIVCGLLIV